MIQERVQARFKCEDLIAGMRKGIVDSGNFKPEAVESALVMSVYMHTAFEVGKESGLNDIDAFVKNFIDEKMAAEKEANPVPEENKEA